LINISLFRDTYSYNPGQEVVKQSLAELRVIAECEDGQDECPSRMRGSALNPLRRAERKYAINLPGKTNLSSASGRHIRHSRGSPGTPMQNRPPRRTINRRETPPGGSGRTSSIAPGSPQRICSTTTGHRVGHRPYLFASLA